MKLSASTPCLASATTQVDRRAEETPAAVGASVSRARSASALTDLPPLLKRSDATAQVDPRAEQAAPRTAERANRLSSSTRSDLRSYVTGKNLLSQPVEPPDIKRLLHASHSMDRARKSLPFGPGNAKDNGAGTSEGWAALDASYRGRRVATLLARDAEGTHERDPTSPKPTSAQKIAGALSTGGGNCGEFSFVTAFKHADITTDTPTQIRKIVGAEVDHSWAVEAVDAPGKSPRPILLDSWAKGPAVFVKDSHVDGLAVRQPIDLQVDRTFKDEVNTLRSAATGKLGSIDRPPRDFRFPEASVLERGHSVSVSFAKEVSDAMQEVSNGEKIWDAAESALRQLGATEARGDAIADTIKTTRVWAKTVAEEPHSMHARDGDPR